LIGYDRDNSTLFSDTTESILQLAQSHDATSAQSPRGECDMAKALCELFKRDMCCKSKHTPLEFPN
jgi:hypothetical protein